jgi:hypothetical protein
MKHASDEVSLNMPHHVDERIDRDRLSVVTGALLLALTLARLLDVPDRTFNIDVLGSPLGVSLSETTILMLVIAGLAATGVESLVRAHPLIRQGALQRTVVFWIVPALLSMALASWLSRIPDVALWTLGMLAAALLVPFALVAEYTAVSPGLRRDTWLQWSYNVLIHVVALILLFALYDVRLRGLLGAPLLFITITLLASRLYWSLTGSTRKAVTYGAVTGLPLAQLLLIINYWPLSGFQGGLVLLLAFYVVVGLMQRYLKEERLERQYILEHLVVALTALVVILLVVS